jgi:hypothetical protein
MDTYDYQANCFKARSLEVAFDADQTQYLDYVNDLFRLIDNFAAQNILYGGYISLRYCGKSEAKLAIEQWQHTVCLEMSTLSGLDNEMQVLNAFEASAARFGAAIHWGQLNNRTRTLLHAVFHSGKMPPRLARHHYDLARLYRHEYGQLAMKDFGLLASVVEHKKIFFREGCCAV